MQKKPNNNPSHRQIKQYIEQCAIYAKAFKMIIGAYICILTLCMFVNVSRFGCRLLTFFSKINFFSKYLTRTISERQTVLTQIRIDVHVWR